MKNYIALALSILMLPDSNAQKAKAPGARALNNISLGGGDGSGINFNYERLVPIRQNFFLSARKRHFLFPLIGYRLQPVKPSKINIRAYLCYPFSGNPYSGDSDNLFFIPAGFSIGWCF
jgi:hypothetical protein